MAKIDNPFYGKIGAFWVEGNNEPFYGITEAKKYQYDRGGDVLNFRGKVAIHDPEPNVALCSKCGTRMHGHVSGESAAHCAGCTPQQMTAPPAKRKKSGFFHFFG